MKALVALVLLVGSSCASMDQAMSGAKSMPDEEKRAEIVKQFPDLSAEKKTQFVKGEPWIGMTQAQLNAYLGAEPGRTQKKISSAGSQEIELYQVRSGNWKTGVKTRYFRAVVTSGKLSEFQELDNLAGGFDKL